MERKKRERLLAAVAAEEARLAALTAAQPINAMSAKLSAAAAGRPTDGTSPRRPKSAPSQSVGDWNSHVLQYSSNSTPHVRGSALRPSRERLVQLLRCTAFVERHSRRETGGSEM